MQRFYLLFIFVSLIFSSLSCRKDIVDSPPGPYGDKYVGKYEFEIKTYHWMIDTEPSWTTTTSAGMVLIYDSTATYPYVLNTGLPFFSITDKQNGITIGLNEYAVTHCVLQTNDTIRTYSGYHYHHDGYFKDDSLYINITGLGGLGGGTDYFVRGKRLE